MGSSPNLETPNQDSLINDDNIHWTLSSKDSRKRNQDFIKVTFIDKIKSKIIS